MPKSRTFPFKTAILCLGAGYLAFSFAYGPRTTPDLRDYSIMADTLSAVHFNAWRYFREGQSLSGVDRNVPVLFYSVYAALIAGARAVLGPYWVNGLIAVNVAALTAAGGAVLWTVHRVTRGVTAPWVALAFLAGLFDYFQWAAMTQSDPVFVAEAVGSVSLAISGSTTNPVRHRAALWIASTGLLALAVFSRPAWPPVAATVAVAAILAPVFRSGAPRTRALALWVGGAGGAVVMAMLAVVCARAYFHPATLPPGALRDIISYYRADFVTGIVVLARPETYVTGDESVSGILRVMAARLAYFFWYAGADFSPRHAMYNAVTHVPLYLLAAVGAATAVQRTALRHAAFVSVIAVTWVILTDAYHAVTHLDYGWRYRMPVYPALIMLAAIGADGIETRIRQRAGKARSTHDEGSRMPVTAPRSAAIK